MTNPQDSNCHLQGLGVLVTRPESQSVALSEAIAEVHGRPIRLPTIEITSSDDPQLARDTLAGAVTADLLIFTSRNAVQYAFDLLPDTLPERLQIAAIGQATALALEDIGLPASLVPTDVYTSEALLALDVLQQLPGQRVIIVRGENGRPLLGDTLRARGAVVEYADVYRRQCPTRRPAGLINGWDAMIGCVTITSAESLDNLLTILGPETAERAKSTPMIVVSDRIADHARTLGCTNVRITHNASDTAIVAALCKAFGKA
ncbi:MAG: uroporphyrinogen-III synthase [bacterium]